MPPRFEHEHDDEHEDDLVADLGVSSVERSAALRLCGESPVPYTFAVSMKFPPLDTNRSIIAKLSFSVASFCLPNVMAPRQSSLTRKPVFPRYR
jgi:hypothetical protein